MRTSYLQTFLFLLVVLTASIGPSLFGQDLYDAQHSKQFAEYLFKTERYSEAAVEYERVIFLGEEDDEIRLQLLRAMDFAGQGNAALERMSFWFEDLAEMPPSLAMFYARRQYRFERQSLLMNQFVELKQIPNEKMALLKSATYLHELDWDQALLSIVDLERINNSLGVQQRSVMERGQNLPRKSPMLAASLSALIPGAGKMYSGQWQDGLISFFIISTTAWMAYRGFESDGTKSARGWIFGGLSMGFYLGNIYGSQKAAKVANKKYIHAYHSEVDRFFLDHFK